MKQFLCELLFSCILAAPGAKPVDELVYGQLLYDYYQNDYEQALVSAMVAEAQGRRGEDPVRFELAAGSFAFGQGMYETARQTFAAVADSELTELDRMRLAFHLAREYHRRGDHAAMAMELEKISFESGWFGRRKFHPEVEFMRAEAAMAQGDLTGAEAMLERLDGDDPLLAYGRFNLGVAYREVGDLESSRRVFSALAGQPIRTRGRRATPPETRDLIERARLALAFVARESQQPADAADVLGNLPGDGRYRDVALASYGGLAMETGDYELAARIWLTLQNEDYWTSSTAQARLGFPMSLERLASQDTALVQYRKAEQSFEARLALLTDLSERAEDPAWVRDLLKVFATPEQADGRRQALVERWREQLGHTDWLEWLATEETHQVLTEWRELSVMSGWLERLPETLATFEEVASERRRRSAAAGRLLHDEALLAKREALAEEVAHISTTIEALRGARAERSLEWMRKLATPEELALLRQLDEMRAAFQQHLTGPDQARMLARIDRLEGTVFWTIADNQSERLRILSRTNEENRLLLSDLDDRIARVATAEAEFAAGVETDFLQFADRAQTLTAQVEQARSARELALAEELRRGMAREMQEVRHYLLATRIGIARATDRLALLADHSEGE